VFLAKAQSISFLPSETGLLSNINIVKKSILGESIIPSAAPKKSIFLHNGASTPLLKSLQVFVIYLDRRLNLIRHILTLLLMTHMAVSKYQKLLKFSEIPR